MILCCMCRERLPILASPFIIAVESTAPPSDVARPKGTQNFMHLCPRCLPKICARVNEVVHAARVPTTAGAEVLDSIIENQGEKS